jgi:large subunit ribosomal protein L18
MSSIKIKKRNKIKKRIKQKVLGNKICPRLSVFRSNKEIYAQLIDDQNGNTLVSASSRDKDLSKKDASRTELSKLLFFFIYIKI